jgi:hypothetical protein
MGGVPRPRDSKTSETRSRSTASTRPRTSAPTSPTTRDLVDHILDAAPELEEMTAVAIALRLGRERAVSARAVADHLGLRKTDWVYANAELLGGRRLGKGKGARWRFYLSEVDGRLREFGERPPAPRRAKTAARSHAPRRGKRRPGVTTAGNALLDFEAA